MSMVDNVQPVLGRRSTSEGLGGEIPILLPRLIESRLLITGNSGSGKSRTLRRIIEQTFGKVQQIILDPEDEFYTLREKFDFVLTGAEGADCPTSVSTAKALAGKIMELNLSAVIGLADLDLEERLDFVGLFIGQIMRTPRTQRRPLLVVLDEADIYAPEGSKTDAAKAVINLCVRGRKRGFCPILGTQRPAMLSKSAASACVNMLVGRQSADIDVDRAAKNLGMRRQEKMELTRLKQGEFFAVGPAFDLNSGVACVKVGEVETTHPTAGMAMGAPPPPRTEAARIVAQLVKLGETQPEPPGEKTSKVAIPESDYREIRAEAYEEGAAEERRRLRELLSDARGYAEAFKQETAWLADVKEENRNWIISAPGHVSAFHLCHVVLGLPNQLGNTEPVVTVHADFPVKPATATALIDVGRKAADHLEETNGDSGLSEMAKRILTVIVQHPAGLTRRQINVHSGYQRSGHFSTTVASLLKGQLVTAENSVIKPTSSGAALLGNVPRLPRGPELFGELMKGDRLNEMEKKMLQVIAQEPRRRGEVLQAAGYMRSGHASTSFSRLIRLGYVVPVGSLLRLSEDLQ